MLPELSNAHTNTCETYYYGIFIISVAMMTLYYQL